MQKKYIYMTFPRRAISYYSFLSNRDQYKSEDIKLFCWAFFPEQRLKIIRLNG